MNTIDELKPLWENSINDDEKSFALLHRALYPSLFSYALRMLKDEELTDDLLQDLFIKFWQGRDNIGILANVKAYFFKSTRSMVLNYFRTRNSLEAKLDAMPVPELDFSKEELIMSHEFDIALRDLMLFNINKLPAKQREIIYMRFYQDLDYIQITEITGIKYQSVVNHVYRSIQTLREICNFSEIYAA